MHSRRTRWSCTCSSFRMWVDRVVPAGSTEGSWLGSRNVSNFFTDIFL